MQEYIAPLLQGIKTLTEAGELPATAEATRAQLYGHTNLANAQAGAIPSQIEEHQAHAGFLRQHGENAPLILSPGQVAMQTSTQRGAPATEIARGLSEKAINPSSAQHMSEADKLAYQAAAHIFTNSFDPEEKKTASARMNAIDAKYATQAKPRVNMLREEAEKRLKEKGFDSAKIKQFLVEQGFPE